MAKIRHQTVTQIDGSAHAILGESEPLVDTGNRAGEALLESSGMPDFQSLRDDSKSCCRAAKTPGHSDALARLCCGPLEERARWAFFTQNRNIDGDDRRARDVPSSDGDAMKRCQF